MACKSAWGFLDGNISNRHKLAAQTTPPITVVEDDDVGGCQINTETTSACRKEE